MALQFHLFGLPKIVDQTDVTAVRLNGPSLLLIYLAIKGDWVSRSELAFLFRPDDDEVSALKQIRLLLYRAKKLPWAEALETDPQRARFAVATDVADFRRALGEENWPAASTLYKQRLLADYSNADLPTYTSWLELERAELEERYLDALKRYASDLEQQGNYTGAAQVLRDYLKLDNLAEDVVQAHLKNLYLAGQRDEALRAYQLFRDALQEAHDAEPLEETEALAEAIRERKPVEAGERAELSRVVLRGPDQPLNNLPRQSTRFIGRKKELRDLARQLANDDCRLLSLVGLGGTGKTRLALELAHAEQDKFADGVCFVPLAPLSSSAGFMTSLAQALGLTLAPRQDPQLQVTQYLKDKHLLLLLDNFEHVTDAAPLLSELLAGTDRLKLLVTSRESLKLGSEWLFDLEGLDYPGDGAQLPRDMLETFDAVALFITSARRVVPNLELSHADLQHIARISQQVQGLPLALELAASWVRVMPIGRVASELMQGYALLETEHADLPERHRNLKAILDKTWTGLSEKKRHALTRLTVFQGGCSLEAAEEVAETHFTVLLSLINESLVKRSTRGRMELHPLVHRYASSKLCEVDRLQTFGALCQFFANFSAERDVSLRRGDESRILRELSLESANLDVVWDYCCARGFYRVLEATLRCYHFLLDTQGAYKRGADAFLQAMKTVAVAPVSDEQQALHARVLARAGYHQFRLGHVEDAKALLEQSLTQLGTLSLPLERGFAQHYLGVLAFSVGNNEEAGRRYRAALECYEQAGDERAKSQTQNNLGVLADILGRYDEAMSWYNLALESSKKVDNVRGVASALVNLGIVLETLGRFGEAVQHYQESLHAYREVHDIRGEAASLMNLGHLAEKQEAYEEAKHFYEQSLTLKRMTGDPITTAVSLTNLGDVLLKLGRTQEGLGVLLESLLLTQRAGALPFSLRTVWSYAKYYAQSKQWALALYLIAFIRSAHEAEAWLLNEVGEAFDAWRAHMTPEELARTVLRAQQVSFEALSQELQARI